MWVLSTSLAALLGVNCVLGNGHPGAAGPETPQYLLEHMPVVGPRHALALVFTAIFVIITVRRVDPPPQPFAIMRTVQGRR